MSNDNSHQRRKRKTRSRRSTGAEDYRNSPGDGMGVFGTIVACAIIVVVLYLFIRP